MRSTGSKGLLHLAVILLALGFGASCGRSTKPVSAVKVTNGIAIQESKFPSTVLLVIMGQEGEAICTGTFVNDSQVITAGHCVEGLDTAKPAIYFARERSGSLESVAQAVSFVRNPRYSHALGVSPYDLSLITFPAHTAPAISPLAAATPAVGTSFTIVGYGNNENFLTDGTLDGQGAGVKRTGTNVVEANSGGMLSFGGLTGSEGASRDGEKAGEYVGSGAGDSGGPLFVNGKLAGVTSGGGLRTNRDGLEITVSFYVDINSSTSKKFLATALKQ